MTAEELDDLLAGIAPVIQSYVSTTFADLQKQVAAIDAKAAVPGPGISSLLISADSRLVAHLTDGRTLDVGPVPVREPVPGPAGRDADPVKVFALETELAALRSETLAKAEEWRLERAQLVEDLATVKRFGDDLSARVDVLKALPVPRDGQDGSSVTVDDVAPLIEAVVQKSLSTLPAPVAAPAVDVEGLVVAEVQKAVAAIPPAKDGEPGRSVDPNDVERMISARVSSWVTKAVADIPVPKDGAPGERGAPGQSLTPVDVEPLILEHVAKAVAAIPAPLDGRPGADGVSVSVQDVTPLIATEIQKAVAALPAPRDGQDGSSVDPAMVDVMVKQHVSQAVSEIRVPKDGVDGKDGTSVAAEDLDALVSLHVEKAVAAMPPAHAGKDGASVTVDDVAPLILAEVHKAAALIPDGKDGKPGPAGADGTSVTVDDVAPLIADEVTKAVSAVPVPKDGRDGVGLAGAVIDRSGHLVLTLSDGAVKELGAVVGRDVDMAEVTRAIEHQVAQIPRPKDGKDGVDGLGFDNYEEVWDGERTITRRFTQGDRVKEFTHKVPALIYRGVWSDGKTYERGDSVTFGGHVWVAKEETTVKPDYTPASAKVWTLSVKAGREGREGKEGPAGPKGSKGDPGGVYK